MDTLAGYDSESSENVNEDSPKKIHKKLLPEEDDASSQPGIEFKSHSIEASDGATKLLNDESTAHETSNTDSHRSRKVSSSSNGKKTGDQNVDDVPLRPWMRKDSGSESSESSRSRSRSKGRLDSASSCSEGETKKKKENLDKNKNDADDKQKEKNRSQSKRSRSKSVEKSRRYRSHRSRSKERRRKRRSRSRERRRSRERKRRRSHSKERKDDSGKDGSKKSDHSRRRSRSHSRERRRHRRRRSSSRSRQRRHRRHRRRSRSRSRSRSRDRKSPARRVNQPVTFKQKMKQDLIEASQKGASGSSVIPPLMGSIPAASLSLNMIKPLITQATANNPAVTPQEALQQTMAAMHQKAQELTGIAVPKYYNPAAVNPLKYAEQVQKRKLLWAKKEPVKESGEVKEGKPEVGGAPWKATHFAQDSDGKMTHKFRKLMGIAKTGEDEGDDGNDSPEDTQEVAEVQRKQDELYANLDKQYEFARMATHTHRGVGLGFASQNMPNVPPK